MAYQYDVFISYKSESKDWVLKAFLPLFERHLQEALGGRKPSIFMDMQRIENGDAWRNTLRYALAHSRCVVAVLTPSYFHSEWCTKELSVMLHRAKQHGLLTKEIPGGLIAPLCVSDGEHFPQLVQEIQQERLHDYYSFAEAFPLTKPYVKFEKQLKKWLPIVANIIRRAPEWQPEWLEDAWLEVPHQDLLIGQPPFAAFTLKLEPDRHEKK